MFQLSKNAWRELITNCDKLPENIKFSLTTPFAFTEQSVASVFQRIQQVFCIKIFNLIKFFKRDRDT
ncbi:hypothetical protein DHD80_16270 [Gramella sp. AN32]|nr:hypothetical protein [Gramella sp. AN32]